MDLEQIESYTIDLTEIRERGEFKCPKCGTVISPHDKSEDVYTILETVMKKDCLEKIVLQCNRCRSQVHLIGFNVLNK